MALEHVISFYSVSQEVEPIIRMGPGPSQNGIPTLEPFLKAMDRLQSAQEYFEKNNPQSVELENVVSNSNNFLKFISFFYKHLFGLMFLIRKIL